VPWYINSKTCFPTFKNFFLIGKEGVGKNNSSGRLDNYGKSLKLCHHPSMTIIKLALFAHQKFTCIARPQLAN